MSDQAATRPGPRVCPFLAFGHDRDRRAGEPDGRHRCFAQTPPATPAIGHQDVYCLAPTFPGCPVFQAWAQREAARTAGADGGRGADASATGSRGATVVTGDPAPADDHDVAAVAASPAPLPWERNGGARAEMAPGPLLPDRRDWKAPPPWAPRGPGGAAAPGAAEESPDAVVRVTRGGTREATGPDPRGDPATEDGAERATSDADAATSPEPAHRRGRAATLISGRAARRERDDAPDGQRPEWERPRRFEAYPTIRTRRRVGGLPFLLVAVALIALAGAAMFLAPGLLGGLRSPGGPASATRSAVAGASGPASASRSPRSPSPRPSPTRTPRPSGAGAYTVKRGDTFCGIAKRHGLTAAELLAANPQLKDPDRLRAGDTLRIPARGAAPTLAPGVEAPPCQ